MLYWAVVAVAFGAVLTATPTLSADKIPPSAPMDCGNGPAPRTFGGTPWLVYACSDSHSVVLMSAPGSKAMPFYFMFSWENGSYRLIGEGTGNKAATDAAYVALKTLNMAEIMGLFAAGKAAKR
jgi:hypothetical protein